MELNSTHLNPTVSATDSSLSSQGLPCPVYGVHEDGSDEIQATTTIADHFQSPEEETWGWRTMGQASTSWLRNRGGFFGFWNTVKDVRFASHTTNYYSTFALKEPIEDEENIHLALSPTIEPVGVVDVGAFTPIMNQSTDQDDAEAPSVAEQPVPTLQPVNETEVIDELTKSEEVAPFTEPLVESPSPPRAHPTMFPPVPPAYAAFFANTGPSFQYAVAPGASVTTPSFKPVSPLKLDGKHRSIKKLYIPPGPPRPDLDEIVNWHSSEPRVPVPDNTVRIKVIEDPYFRASELPPIVPPPRIRDAAREELLKEVGLRWDMGMDKWYKMKEEEAMRQAEEEAIQRAEEAIRQAKEERKRLIRIEKEKEQEMWAKKVQRIMRLRAQQPVEPVNEAPAGR
ncbi:hypothetical protein BDN72DRAFT_555856, partial [Pluteus cervinus]